MPLRTLPESGMLIAVIAIVVGSVALDQITKAIVVANMELFQELPFLPGFLRLYYTENTGAAFSMLSNHRWVFLLFSIVAMGVIVWLLAKYHRRHPLLAISLASVLGGGIGNLIDRTLHGSVVDFLDFQFVNFAVFNVADIFVTCGSVALAVYIIFVEPRVEKRLKADAVASAEEPSDDGNHSDQD